MRIYIDNDYKCHISNDGTMREFELSFFDGKCEKLIEGYRYVPSGESWTRSDDIIFHGEMIAPWKDYSELDDAQRIYERQLLAEYEAALAEIEAALEVK